MRHLLTLAVFITTTSVADTIDRTGGWDVDAPLGPSAQLEFTTDEGTWMNLDVHPDGTRIIFDLLGDLYVVPIDGGKDALLLPSDEHVGIERHGARTVSGPVTSRACACDPCPTARRARSGRPETRNNGSRWPDPGRAR